MAIGNRVYLKRALPSQELLDAFAKIPAANIADTMGRSCAMNPRLKRMSGATNIMVGPALTVKARAGDNLFIHQALDMAQPGDIIVVSNDEDSTRALMGEVMFTYAQYQRKLGGLVVDGPVRDLDALHEMKLPVYATGSTPGGPHKNGPGEINVPIACGGISVNPGDIILADTDGIIVIPLRDAAAVLEKAQAFCQQDEAKVRAAREGTSKRGWVLKKLREQETEFVDEIYGEHA
ncbi:RraA family protein [uncultured Oscillibacter sp.]|uniref:RraA family protein n=1 Tax=uncultured Oscillibacter sp. TaxID=876091 RepID=UPI0025F81B06|nr:RraA family protein [uncultured Oscillibacter sp.]